MTPELNVAAYNLLGDVNEFISDTDSKKCFLIVERHGLDCDDFANCAECGFALLRAVLSRWDEEVRDADIQG